MFNHGRPQGRAKGGSCPPSPMAGQNSMFFDFFRQKNSMFFGASQANSIFLPPPPTPRPPRKILPSPGRKKWRLQFELWKSRKTRSDSKTDSKVWLKVRNAGPYPRPLRKILPSPGRPCAQHTEQERFHNEKMVYQPGRVPFNNNVQISVNVHYTWISDNL